MKKNDGCLSSLIISTVELFEYKNENSRLSCFKTCSGKSFIILIGAIIFATQADAEGPGLAVGASAIGTTIGKSMIRILRKENGREIFFQAH